MSSSSDTLKCISANLNALRQDPKTRRKFPQKFWDSLFQLAKTLPLNEICQQLDLNPVYVKNKMSQYQQENLDFFECAFSDALTATVIIELSVGELRAKIQGPVSCIDRLSALLRR